MAMVLLAEINPLSSGGAQRNMRTDITMNRPSSGSPGLRWRVPLFSSLQQFSRSEQVARCHPLTGRKRRSPQDDQTIRFPFLAGLNPQPKNDSNLDVMHGSSPSLSIQMAFQRVGQSKDHFIDQL